MSGDLEKTGILSFLSLSEDEMRDLLHYLGGTRHTEVYDFLYLFLGDDLLQFLDVFSGESIRLVSRSDVLKAITNMRLYQYISGRGEVEDSFNAAASRFGLKKNVVRKIYFRTKDTLERRTDYVTTGTSGVRARGRRVGGDRRE